MALKKYFERNSISLKKGLHFPLDKDRWIREFNHKKGPAGSICTCAGWTKGLIGNLWHHLPAPHSQKNRAQPNSVSRFCQNYFCSTLETLSGGSKAKTVNDHGRQSFTRFDSTPYIQILQQQFCYKKTCLKSQFKKLCNSVWWLSQNYLTIAWRMSDDCLTTARWIL